MIGQKCLKETGGALDSGSTPWSQVKPSPHLPEDSRILFAETEF